MGTRGHAVVGVCRFLARGESFGYGLYEMRIAVNAHGEPFGDGLAYAVLGWVRPCQSCRECPLGTRSDAHARDGFRSLHVHYLHIVYAQGVGIAARVAESDVYLLAGIFGERQFGGLQRNAVVAVIHGDVFHNLGEVGGRRSRLGNEHLQLLHGIVVLGAILERQFEGGVRHAYLRRHQVVVLCAVRIVVLRIHGV